MGDILNRPLPHYSRTLAFIRRGGLKNVYTILSNHLSKLAFVTSLLYPFCLLGYATTGSTLISIAACVTTLLILFPTKMDVCYKVVDDACAAEIKYGVPKEQRSYRWWLYIYYIVFSNAFGVWRFGLRLVGGAALITLAAYCKPYVEPTSFVPISISVMVIAPLVCGISALIIFSRIKLVD